MARVLPLLLVLPFALGCGRFAPAPTVASANPSASSEGPAPREHTIGNPKAGEKGAPEAAPTKKAESPATKAVEVKKEEGKKTYTRKEFGDWMYAENKKLPNGVAIGYSTRTMADLQKVFGRPDTTAKKGGRDFYFAYIYFNLTVDAEHSGKVDSKVVIKFTDEGSKGGPFTWEFVP